MNVKMLLECLKHANLEKDVVVVDDSGRKFRVFCVDPKGDDLTIEITEI